MIREIKISDFKELNQLNKEELGYAISTKLTKQKIETILHNPMYVCFGYEDEDHKLIGYIHVEIYDTFYAPTMFNVLGLAVSSNNRRQGIGKMLILEIENEAKKRGISFIRLNSGAGRKDAYLFYETLGYEGNKVQKRFIKYL